MKFYLGNKANAGFDTDPGDVAALFWTSRQGRQVLDPRYTVPLERALRDWLTDPAGYNASWEDESDATGFGLLLSEARKSWPKTRIARVARGRSGSSFGNVAAYLPANYWIIEDSEDQGVIIQGTDNAGWTLEGYVIPRLASGLINAEEITEGEL
jgi:hypothetical protein